MRMPNKKEFKRSRKNPQRRPPLVVSDKLIEAITEAMVMKKRRRVRKRRESLRSMCVSSLRTPSSLALHRLNHCSTCYNSIVMRLDSMLRIMLRSSRLLSLSLISPKKAKKNPSSN